MGQAKYYETLENGTVVNFDNVHVVLKKLLGERMGALDPQREKEIKRAMGYALDWPELKVL